MGILATILGGFSTGGASLLLKFAPYLIVAGLAGFMGYRLEEVKYETLVAKNASAAARENAAAAEAVMKDKVLGDQQVAELLQQNEIKQQAFNETRKEILSAPNSSSCIGSRPVAALLDGLRGGPGAGTQGRAGASSAGAADLPPAARRTR